MNKKHIFLLLIAISVIACGDKKEHRKQQFLLKGNEAYKKQNINGAIHYFQEAIKTDSCYSPAYNNLATIYYDQGNLDKALHLYEQAVSCDPAFYQAQINLSNTLYDLKQYYRGLDVINKQIVLTPDSADVYFAAGLHLTKLREYDNAIERFGKAKDLDPGNKEVLINLGTLNYYQEDYTKAKEYLNMALEIDGELSEAYNTLALIAAAEEDYNQALTYINKAIKLDKEPHYLNNRGFIYINLAKSEDALQDINESITIDPMNAWAFRNKAILLLKENQPKEALALLERAEKLDDWVEYVNYYKGMAYIQLQDISKACEMFSKGVELKETKAEKAAKEYCNN